MNNALQSTRSNRGRALTPSPWKFLLTLILTVLPSLVSAQAGDPWLIMDGTNPGYIEVPHNAALNPENITVEAWVNLPSGSSFTGSTNPTIVGKNYQSAWWFSILSRKISFISHGSNTGKISSGMIPIGEWVHIAATYDGSQIRFYINGSLDSEFVQDLGPMPANTSPMRIGSDVSYDVRPHGAIDEVRIWNVARSEGEIAGMMNTPISSAMTGLVAVWSLDGAPAATVGGFGGANVGETVYGNTVPEGNPCVREYFLTSAAHSDGEQGTKWITDVYLYNNSGSATTVRLFLLPQNVDNSAPAWIEVEVGPYQSIALEDIVLADFGEDGMSAALRICSDQHLLTDSRTYNSPSTDGPTFGQGGPGFPNSVASRFSRKAIGLYQNDQFRTNIGMLNTSPEPTTVTVWMFTQERVLLGSKEFQLGPYGYLQRSRIFTRVTGADVENGFIEVESNGSPILVYATVVDNLIGDGTFKLAR